MTHAAACPTCPRPLATGRTLCPMCVADTATRLTRLPALYTALEVFLAPVGGRPEHGHTSRAEPPLPVRLDTLTLRAAGGITGVLLDWERAVRDALGWPAPPLRGDLPRVLAGSAGFLRGNLLWVAEEFPAAGDLAAEIRQLEHAVLAVIDPGRAADRPRRLGGCPTEYDGVPCGAAVTLAPGSTTALCRWCGTSWTPAQWLNLAAAQGAAA